MKNEWRDRVNLRERECNHTESPHWDLPPASARLESWACVSPALNWQVFRLELSIFLMRISLIECHILPLHHHLQPHPYPKPFCLILALVSWFHGNLWKGQVQFSITIHQSSSQSEILELGSITHCNQPSVTWACVLHGLWKPMVGHEVILEEDR